MARIMWCIVAVALLVAFFIWGISESNKAERADCEKEIMVKEVEVIKYVTKEKAQIWTRPSVGLSVSLKRMRNSEL